MLTQEGILCTRNNCCSMVCSHTLAVCCTLKTNMFLFVMYFNFFPHFRGSHFKCWTYFTYQKKLVIFRGVPVKKKHSVELETWKRTVEKSQTNTTNVNVRCEESDQCHSRTWQGWCFQQLQPLGIRFIWSHRSMVIIIIIIMIIDQSSIDNHCESPGYEQAGEQATERQSRDHVRSWLAPSSSLSSWSSSSLSSTRSSLKS